VRACHGSGVLMLRLRTGRCRPALGQCAPRMPRNASGRPTAPGPSFALQREACLRSVAQCPAAWAQALPSLTLFLGPDKTERARRGRPQAPKRRADKGMSPGQRSPHRNNVFRGGAGAFAGFLGAQARRALRRELSELRFCVGLGCREICFQSFSRSAGTRGDWHS